MQKQLFDMRAVSITAKRRCCPTHFIGIMFCSFFSFLNSPVFSRTLFLGDNVFHGSDARLAAFAVLGEFDKVVVELLIRCRASFWHRFERMLYRTCRIRHLNGENEWHALELILQVTKGRKEFVHMLAFSKLHELLLENVKNCSCLHIVLGFAIPEVVFMELCRLLPPEHPNSNKVIEILYSHFDWNTRERIHLNSAAMMCER
jgi:hypothetical protein